MISPIYKIKSIKHVGNNQPRTDGRYPKRIGRTCLEPNPVIGQSMCIDYMTDEHGNDYIDYHLRVSNVQDVSRQGNSITITTLNSIYEFEKMEG